MRPYTFTLDKMSILQHPRLMFVESDIVPIGQHLNDIEHYLNECYAWEGHTVVQHGRVIILRATDETRKSSAFKAGIYLGKYNDMGNTDRFLKGMVSARHSYEPIRAEVVSFLFIGVGKPVYDHLTTYSTGRYGRIAGGQRANVPWGFEIPVEARHREMYYPALETIRAVATIAKRDKEEQMQAIRSTLPVGYIMPPFILEFSEEALIKSVFRQRLFEKGAQGATQEVVADMFKALHKIDATKWEFMEDYHGAHTVAWEKCMRTLRSRDMSVADFSEYIGMEMLKSGKYMQNVKIYDFLLEHFGKIPPNMWEKQK